MSIACDEKNVIVRTSLSNQAGFYEIQKNGKPSDIYETKDSILKNMNDPLYNDINEQKKYGNKCKIAIEILWFYLKNIFNLFLDEQKQILVDFDSKKFNGYLVDKSTPYNMYLKVGIGGKYKKILFQPYLF